MDALVDDQLLGHHFGLFERLVGALGVADLPAEDMVAVLARAVGAAGLALQIVAQAGHAGIHGVVRIDLRRQPLVFDRDEIDRVGGDIAVLGHDEGDFLALEQHFVAGQHGLHVASEGGHEIELQGFQIGRGQHRLHPRQLERRLLVDRFDAGMAIGRADEIAEQHAREFQIVDVIPLALGEADILDALALGAETFELLGSRFARFEIGAHSAASLA